MHLSDARDSWLRALRAEGASRNTLEIYSSAVDRFIEYLRDHHRPTDVTKIRREDVQGFLTHLQDTRSQATAHNRFRALRALLNYCSDGGDERTLRREPLGIIDRSPMRRMAAPKLDDVPIPLLAPEQVDLLWHVTERPGKDFTKRRDAAMIRMFLASGIRAGEMATLRLEDVDLNAQQLTVGGKGRKWRRVPYSGAAAVALDRYLAVRPQSKWASRSDRVWLGIKGHMTRSGVQQMLERVGKQTEIPDLHPHRLRHTFVDACFTEGMSEGEVMALMGWSSTAMCRRYASARRSQRAITTYHRLGIGDPYKRRPSA
jgi:integrase/recombinase XerC